ncbi:hypothetical protein TNCV_4949651 [Trichonephila clavipes]|nr:hypothetical protein TNCV_4949651 [Trichonephila clavipes]
MRTSNAANTENSVKYRYMIRLVVAAAMVVGVMTELASPSSTVVEMMNAAWIVHWRGSQDGRQLAGRSCH